MKFGEWKHFAIFMLSLLITLILCLLLSSEKDTNIQVMWDYCILSKLEVEQSSEELDEGDHMHLDNFTIWAEFFSKYGTLPATQENEIMDLFKYFVGRDILLLAEGVNNNVENT